MVNVKERGEIHATLSISMEGQTGRKEKQKKATANERRNSNCSIKQEGKIDKTNTHGVDKEV